MKNSGGTYLLPCQDEKWENRVSFFAKWLHSMHRISEVSKKSKETTGECHTTTERKVGVL